MTLLVETALQSGAFILLLALLRPLMKRSLSARARFALWALPALRLMLPLRITSIYSLWGWLAPAADKPLMAANPVFLPQNLPPVAQPVAAAPVARPVAVPAAPSAALPQAPGPDWAALLPNLLVWAWILGALIMLGRFLLINYRFYTLTKGRRPLRVRGIPLPMLVVEGLDSPCLFGLFRPRILLNRASLQSDTMLDMVLSHELAHWQRRDHLWALLRSLLLCAWWWNPLVWLAAALSRVDGEAACDEAVTRGMDKQEREAYGMSLITLMQRGKAPGGLLAAGTAYVSGKRQLKERITMIADRRRKNRAIALSFLLIIALCLPLLFSAAQGPETTGEMDAEGAIAIAREMVPGRVVYDDGIQGFYSEEASLQWKEWAGIQHQMWVVNLGVIHGHNRTLLEVHILPEIKAAVFIGDGKQPLWQGDAYLPEIPRNENRQAWVKPREGGAASMRHLPYSGNYPAMLLYEGLPVTLTRVTPGLGDGGEEWADVDIGRSGDDEGVSGYVLLSELAFEKPAAQHLTGTLAEKETRLQKDTGLTGTSLGAFPQGTEARILGRTRAYYHVMIGEIKGYVPLAALHFDEKTEAALKALMPQDPLDEIQPGWQARHDEYKRKLNRLYNQNGPMGTWTLEQMAEGGKLAQEYGFVWLMDGEGNQIIPVVPGPGELSQEQAYAKALETAGEAYQFEESAVIQHNIGYAHPEGQPEAREWTVRFWLMGKPDCLVRLDRAGKVLEQKQLPGRVMGENAAITKDKAIQIARDTLINREGREASEVDSWKMTLLFTYDIHEQREREYWHLTFHVPDAQGPGSAGEYVVQVDAMTGDVMEVWRPEGNG